MLIRHTLAYLPAQLLSPLLQLTAALYLTYVLGAADYGITMLIFASQELVFLVCLSWWTTFYLRYGGRWTGDGGPTHTTTTTTLAATEAAVLTVSSLAQVMVTVLVILATEPGLPFHFYAAACVFTVTRSTLGFLSERARRESHICAYSALQIAAPLLGLALTAACVALGWVTPAYVLTAFALAQAAVGLAVAAHLRMLVRPRWPDSKLLRAALAFGAPVVLSNLLSWLGGNLIRFVVHHGAGAAALGLLSVGWGLATRLAGVAAMLVTAAAYPLAVKAMEAGDAAGAKRQLSDNSVLLLALLAPTAAGMAVLSAPFTELLVAPQYHAMTTAILPWALLGACIRNLRMHGWDQLYLLCEAPRTMVVLDAVEVAVTLAGAVLGLWWGGVPGAVIGSTAAAVLVALGDWLYLRRRFGLQAPFWRYVKVILAALGMVGALNGFTRLDVPTGPGAWPLVGAAMLGGLVYAALLILLFPRETATTVSWAKAKVARA